jgi:hypothetical protein
MDQVKTRLCHGDFRAAASCSGCEDAWTLIHDEPGTSFRAALQATTATKICGWELDMSALDRLTLFIWPTMFPKTPLEGG